MPFWGQQDDAVVLTPCRGSQRPGAGGRIIAAFCGGEYAVDLDEGAAGSIGLPALNATEQDCLRATPAA